MKSIFEQVEVGGVSLRNRLIRSATYEMGMTDAEGGLTERYDEFYLPLLRGGVGGVITGMMSVCDGGGSGPAMANTTHSNFVPNLHRLVELAHREGAALIVQLVHAGVKSSSKWGPSEVELFPNKDLSHAMTVEEIASVVQAFGQSALRCKEAGADAVQFHGAHGYLLSQFLSPIYNKRIDAYGGPIENRARFLLEVYDEVRRQVGPDYPIWVKINSTDLEEPSTTLEEYIWVCEELDRRGIQALEVSAGLGNGRKSSPSRPVASEAEEGFFLQGAIAVAGAVEADVITTGGYRSYAVVEAALQTDGIEAVGLSRPLIREPELPNRWKSGDLDKATCVSCSLCFRPKERFGCNVEL